MNLTELVSLAGLTIPNTCFMSGNHHRGRYQYQSLGNQNDFVPNFFMKEETMIEMTLESNIK